MSEHFSALAQVTIDRNELISYLDGTPRLTSHWDDWDAIGERTYGGLARVDTALRMGVYRYQIRRIFSTCDSIGRFFQYDDATRCFTFGTFFFSEDVDDLAFFFAVARGLARYLHGSDSGFAVADRVLWGEGPQLLMELSPGHSRFLEAAGGEAFARRREQAAATFEALKMAYGVENPRPIDQLDAVR
jgi:hypothetical protein